MIVSAGTACAAFFARPRIYGLFLMGAFVATVGFAVLGTLVKPNPWKLLDWLISYAGGFVRRGLFGEAAFGLQRLTGLGVDLSVMAVQLGSYGLLFWGLWRLAEALPDRRPALWLLYAPFVALFQIADWTGGFRKEVLLLAVVAVLAVRLARAGEAGVFAATVGALALAPLLILGHEMLALYLPYALVPLAVVRWTPGRVAVIAGLLAASALAFGAALMHPGDAETARAICAQVAAEGPLPPVLVNCAAADNPIVWLARSSADGAGLVAELLPLFARELPLALALMGLALLPLWPALVQAPHARALAAAAGVSLLATLPLFAVAVDWGRFLYVHGVCLALMALALVARSGARPNAAGWRIWLVGLLVPIYALGWSLTHTDGVLGRGAPVEIAARLLGGPAASLVPQDLSRPLAPAD